MWTASTNLPYVQQDIYGFKRDSGGNAIFTRNATDTEIYHGGDARAIAEVDSPPFTVPGLTSIPDRSTEHHPRPAKLFITSPNMNWVPDIGQDSETVRIRSDGRFWHHDFTLWPQWYFSGTAHLPFIRLKPRDPEVLEKHRCRIVWHDLQRSEFVRDPTSLVHDLGLVKPSILEEVIAARYHLTDRVQLFINEKAPRDEDTLDMRKFVRNMKNTSAILSSAPQSYFMTLSTFTAFQRHFLEAQACLEYLSIWRPLMLSGRDRYHDVDTTVVGAVTTSLIVAEDFAQAGVPVWLVRAPASVSPGVKVFNRVIATGLRSDAAAKEYSPEIAPVFTGGPSVARNRACQSIETLGGVHLESSARLPQAGASASFDLPQAMPSSSSQTPSSALSIPQALPVPQSSTAHRSLSCIKVSMEINKAKQQPPVSSIFPQALQLWLQALQSVQTNWRDIYDHPDLHIFHGYAAIDPFVLAKVIGGPTHDSVFVAWGLIRSAWLSRLASRRDSRQRMPTPQEWRTYLLVVAQAAGLHSPSLPMQGPNAALSSTAEANKPKKRPRTDRDAIVNSFGLNLPAGQTPDFRWNGSAVLVSAAQLQSGAYTLADNIKREIIWDALEHNFRSELLVLDRSVIWRGAMGEAEAAARDRMVGEVVPGGSFVNASLPALDDGLGARDWRVRARYVEALRKLLSVWPGKPAAMLTSMRLSPHSSVNDVEAVERIAYSFYCQMFFRYFGRIPCVPHHLP